MAGSMLLSSNNQRHSPPQDCDVHQGAILFLPHKHHVEKQSPKDHVRLLLAAGNLVRGQVDHFKVETEDAAATYKAYYHPILVLSRPNADTIEFVTLRSYNDTPLDIKWAHWGNPKGRVMIEHHLSIFPAQHPLHRRKSASVNPTYQTLYLADALQMSASEGCLSVLPVMKMDWRYTERYFLKGVPIDMVSQWRLDDSSMNSVLELARDKARYVPGPQYLRQTSI